MKDVKKISCYIVVSMFIFTTIFVTPISAKASAETTVTTEATTSTTEATTSTTKAATATTAVTPVGMSLSIYYQCIPDSTSLLPKGVVLSATPTYRVTVKASMSMIAGMVGHVVTFNDPNSSTVKLVSTNSVDYNYQATAYYDVRGTTAFSCSASINDGTYSGSTSNTLSPTTSCYYNSSFLITYYVIAKEAEYSGTRNTSMSGISGLYKSSFVSDVKVQGSGYTQDGTYVQYNSSAGTFSIVSFPTTATGTAPTVGKTIAVDPYYVPRLTAQRGKVNIYSVGDRQAEDGGGAITGFHIDVFMGTGKSGVSAPWSMTNQIVQYYGNNLY